MDSEIYADVIGSRALADPVTLAPALEAAATASPRGGGHDRRDQGAGLNE